MEKGKLRRDTVIFLNPNQIILIRDLQKDVSFLLNRSLQVKEKAFCLPLLPICVRNKDLHEKTRIKKAKPCGLYTTESKICLKIEMEIDGKESFGKIELCGLIFEKRDFPKGFPIKNEDFSEIWEKFAPKIKKISPFRLVQIESEESEKGIVWKVLKEKWVKL